MYQYIGIVHIDQRRDCIILESGSLLVETTIIICFSDQTMDERSLIHRSCCTWSDALAELEETIIEENLQTFAQGVCTTYVWASASHRSFNETLYLWQGRGSYVPQGSLLLRS